MKRKKERGRKKEEKEEGRGKEREMQAKQSSRSNLARGARFWLRQVKNPCQPETLRGPGAEIPGLF
jgi:hypothetical protein